MWSQEVDEEGTTLEDKPERTGARYPYTDAYHESACRGVSGTVLTDTNETDKLQARADAFMERLS